MRRLADLPQVSVKISGLGMLDWNWTEASIRPFVREAIAVFGVERAMFASNFPVDRLYSSFDALYEAFHSIVSDLPENDRQALFRDNAARVYRL
jgi:predicted TIM-barrel fold metal-dependent hydrolase